MDVGGVIVLVGEVFCSVGWVVEIVPLCDLGGGDFGH